MIVTLYFVGFTIQNVPIKSYIDFTPRIENSEFTIQNVPIKLRKTQEDMSAELNLQYRMFLLNVIIQAKGSAYIKFTIQNVPIKSYLPQTTYTVYHFSSFLSIPIFSYIFTQNFSLFFI